jgi:redox-sensitive bicupin YhaK (pirin superfamily)
MSNLILSSTPLGRPPWPTLDPFLFCVHHLDNYPEGDDAMAPRATLSGRNIGSDFSGKDGWSMYHGDRVPGFPRHPHRGFETVTVTRRGHIDHADSMGAAARFGPGDAQWMTAGSGIVHSEMFPLRQLDAPNPLELFQIWLNLPSADKMVVPHFAMLWNEDIPRHQFTDDQGNKVDVVTVAGQLNGVQPPSPPPSSWASRPSSNLAIWTIKLDPGATWVVPPSAPEANRVLYVFSGQSVRIAGKKMRPPSLVQVVPDQPLPIVNGPQSTEILLLQGRPIGEPVVQHGPFVMNSREQIVQAFEDYHSTGYGGWPWKTDSPVHDRASDRFARHSDGRTERPPEP